jgi:hypothetical protein
VYDVLFAARRRPYGDDMADGHDTELLVRDARVLSLDPAYDGRVSSIRVVGDRIAAVSDAGLATGPRSVEIPAAGATLVPLMDDTVLRSRGADGVPPVPAPGSPADFVVVSGGVTRRAALRQLVVTPERLLLAVVDGQVVARGGDPLVDSRTHAEAVGAHDPRWGTWVDRTDYLHQHLHADGRYDETRAGRPNAFTGAFWLYRTRIVYLDDSGFWAFGQFVDDELHHAGFVMERP